MLMLVVYAWLLLKIEKLFKIVVYYLISHITPRITFTSANRHTRVRRAADALHAHVGQRAATWIVLAYMVCFYPCRPQGVDQICY